MSAGLPVAVVVCTRDRPGHLRRLLDSLDGALASGDELLVVDSASRTSETADVVRAAGVRLVRCELPGLSRARNTGVAQTSAPVVAFTDDDCTVAPGWLKALREPFDDPSVGVVTGHMAGAEDLAPPTARVRLGTTARGLDAGHGANMAFRRAALESIHGFDEQLGAGSEMPGADDLDAFVRVLRHGWLACLEPMSVVVHQHSRVGARHVELMHGYGQGLGALSTKMLRVDPVVGATVLATVLLRTTRRLLRGSAGGPGRESDAAMLRGIVEGALVMARVPLQDERFAAAPGSSRTARSEWDVAP